jgi:hypothetical protein
MGFKTDSLEFDELTSDPTTPVDGEVWYNSAEERHKLRIGGSTYGVPTFYEWAESTGISTRTSSVYGQKLRLTTSVLVAGDYYVGWQCETGNSGNDRALGVRVQVDDTTTLLENVSKHRGRATENPPIFNVLSGFDVVTLTAGSHDIDLDWASFASTAYIKNARLEIWRLP